MEHPLVIHVELRGVRHLVRRLRGEEAVSETSPLELVFQVPVADPLDPDAVTGDTATVVFERNGVERRFTRVVSACRRGATRLVSRAGVDVELTLVPKLDTLRHRVDLRVFRDRDVPSIVQAVLEDMGIGVERRLSSSYRVRPYTVEWRESDLAFVSRLLESEGIFWIIDDDDRVILGDAPSALDGGPPLPFKDASGLDTGEDAVFEIGERGAMAAGSYTFRDFDFQRPSLDMDGKSAGAFDGGPEVYVFPGKHGDPGHGAERAAMASRASRAASSGWMGKAYAAGLRPGLSLRIEAAPVEPFDLDVTVTRVRHDFDLTKKGFAVEFSAIGRDVLPTPAARTPSPIHAGPMIGYVVGPKGADIHTDPWGRVKIHFPWDRRQPKDDHASDWIPTLQDNTGSSVGIPRIGWEMLVHFDEGDPDRPVILGRVYNPLDDFYAVLPENRMYSALRSLTSPRNPNGPTGENKILFDDRAGFERIQMWAERDRRVLVANDKKENTDVHEERSVLRDERVVVGKDRTVRAGKDRIDNVHRHRTETIGQNRKVRVKATTSESTQANESLRIGGSHRRRIGDSDRTGVKKVFSELVGALDLEASIKDNELSGRWVSAWTVGGLALEIAKNTVSRTTGKLQIDLLGSLTQKAKEAIQQRIGKARTVKIGGSLSVEAGDSVTISAIEELTIEAQSIKLEPKQKLSMTVGSTHWVIAGDKHAIDAPKDVEMRATAKNHLAADVTKHNE
ncbi:MAG TPA: type VI secretion system tip protein TssI/VgrG [Polyangiaceae bacterium]|jgi:type VI secretion system secreted protein VgrG|nr:type VI secretion system tip protein TssI/VgrG [Polyangiaceae bacterium]